ncbi:hypothetical protein VL20_6200 [Microcystis panniformis FACHB-1757]|uniref:Uncharacterized protein n=1 Tax=Microcystis panniformis FACHB-1757 TaxID=1638788 RepID=A0A0K1SA99_9CHRO|nr:hypothetical protein VL20_6200 [Microcystis panniformis FACHB-1757]
MRKTPVKLIKSQRLTKRPGESHLNQRLTRLGVFLPTEAAIFPF